ncbi:MAG: BMP family ABC transporter substrate-binding protein [Panacagrimonas sp.]
MTLSRRQFLASSASLLATGLLTPYECLLAAAGKLTVGALYVGSHDDYGYNQAHAQAVAKLKALPGVKVVEQENVPETVAVQKAMEAMIVEDEAALIFVTSFGYFSHAVKLAPKFPQVRFAHCGGLWQSGKDPANVGSYFGYIDECQYLNGIAAGHATRSKKIGFVAAKPIPQVLRNINAFTLGARSVKPDISTQVIFTGDWSMPVKEAEATNSLADQGIDVVTCHVDSPKVLVETAAKRGLFVCGYHADQSVLAPKFYLTGAEWNWETVYKQYVAAAQAGAAFANLTRGGLKDGFVKMSPYTPVTPAAAKTQIDAIKADMTAGKFDIFKGPLKDNTGKTVIPAGTALVQTDITLESMNYLVEGVIGSTGA